MLVFYLAIVNKIYSVTAILGWHDSKPSKVYIWDCENFM